jgi:pyruvate/2-oxoglutarate dehydrogenase complex dihydrolipoamide acyltransferase (E2) component
MGATKPEPAKPVPTEYRVTAPTSVFGVEPGKTFTREIPEVQEARLLASRAIEKVVDGVKASQAAKDKAAELGLDLSGIEGTGKDGAITVPDIEAAAQVAAEPGTETTQTSASPTQEEE